MADHDADTLEPGDAAPATPPPPPCPDDVARHDRAVAVWQSRRAAQRLWREVTRCVALGH